MRVSRRHTILLAAGLERVLPMFTPLGETQWVAGWQPEFLHPETGAIEQGMVFRTGEAEELTLWTCTEWAPERGKVRYARVTPYSRFGEVEVTCNPVSEQETSVEVSYKFTALSVAGENFLIQFDDQTFRTMIEEWQRDISRWLEAHKNEIAIH